jgi:hypothetical protein
VCEAIDAGRGTTISWPLETADLSADALADEIGRHCGSTQLNGRTVDADSGLSGANRRAQHHQACCPPAR